MAGKKAALTEHAEARVVVVVDQLEELFTLERLSQEDREAFVSALAGLAQSGLAWVIATMWSDFFDQLAGLPSLMALSEGESRYLLAPPTDAEIGQIIRQPAREAGIRFEADKETATALDEELRQAASKDPQALPLLEFVLDELWKRRSEKGLLTYGAYERLGGLEGALGRRAEECFQSQPEDVQAALPSVLRSLVTVGQGEDARATARMVPTSTFAEGTPARTLVEAFLHPDARLLVADSDDAGARERVAHEALLTHWPRAEQQITADRQDLQLRARLEQEAEEWSSANEDDKASWLIPGDLRLSEAEDLMSRRGDELDARLVAFVKASTAAHEAETARKAEQERKLLQAEAQAAKEREAAAQRIARRTRVAAMILGIFVVVALGGAGYGFYGQQKAQEKEREAAIERNNALKSQSHFLAKASREATDKRGAIPGMLLALKALPDDLKNPKRPYVAAAEVSLNYALNAHYERREIAVLEGHKDAVYHAAFSPDGTRIVTASSDSTARLWDAVTGETVAVLEGHKSAVIHADFSPDDRRIVTASGDDTTRLWDAVTRETVAVLEGHNDIVWNAAFSPDGTRIVTASVDYTARIYPVYSLRELIKVARARVGRDLTPEERKEFFLG